LNNYQQVKSKFIINYKDMDEEKEETGTPNVPISDSTIDLIRQENRHESDAVREYREHFRQIFESVQPQTPDHLSDPNNRGIYNQAVGEFFPTLPQIPITEKRDSFPEFDEWLKFINVDSFRQQIIAEFQTKLEKDPAKTFTDGDVEEKLQRKLKSIYNFEAFLDKYHPNFKLGSGQTLDDSEKMFYDYLQAHAKTLTNKFQNSLEQLKDELPRSQPDQDGRLGKFKIISGNSGAGKSTAIGKTDKIQNTPFEVTNDGILVLDSDNIQPWVPGYRNGVGSQNTSAYALSVNRKLLQTAMNNNMDVIMPVVGGQLANVVSEIARAVLAKYQDIELIYVNTPAHVSFQNVVNRGSQPGGRLIPPAIGESSSPRSVYQELSGAFVHPETSEIQQNNPPNLEPIDKKIKDLVKKEMRLQLLFPGSSDRVRIPREQIEQYIAENYPNWENTVHFKVVPAVRTTLAEEILSAIKIAKKLESKKLYEHSDRLIRISMTIINKTGFLNKIL
jgi:hypothetical protein